jgi:hypothetical protein
MDRDLWRLVTKNSGDTNVDPNWCQYALPFMLKHIHAVFNQRSYEIHLESGGVFHRAHALSTHRRYDLIGRADELWLTAGRDHLSSKHHSSRGAWCLVFPSSIHAQ